MEEKLISSICDFWGKDIVNRYSLDGEADLITATNVFAHLDDVRGFLEACHLSLKNTGVLIIENPYIRDFIYKNEFDQVYFEHVSYWSVTPLVYLANLSGLRMIDCKWMDIHGGTMRYVLAKTNSAYNSSGSVTKKMYEELMEEYHLPKTYHHWAKEVYRVAKNLKRNLSLLKTNGFKIAGFAASAKGNTLLNFAEIDHSMIDFIVDQTPEKVGKYSPGTGIPIVGMWEVQNQNPDYIIILSWNFKDEIIEKLRPIFKGKFIIPMPEFQVV
jgi:SAM-dependent methyltransferase